MRPIRRLAKPNFQLAVDNAKRKILREHPRVIAIVLVGSLARGEQLAHSDIDLLSVVKRRPKPESHSYFDQGVYVGMGFVTLTEFKKWDTDHREFFWARGEARSAKVLYDKNGVVTKILKARRNSKTPHRVKEESLGESTHNIIEYLGKLRNGQFKADRLLTRYAARVIAQNAETAVIALNDLSPISENVVWHQVLKAKIRPRHFTTDYPVALGIQGSMGARRVYSSGERLALETLVMIRKFFQTKAKSKAFRALLNNMLDEIR